MSGRRGLLAATCFYALGLCAPAVAMQECEDTILSNQPDGRYEFRFKGLVAYDRVTGLEWMRCPVGQQLEDGLCGGEATQATWQDALHLARKSDYAGRTDWRLPNPKEFGSIIDLSCRYPALNNYVFPHLFQTDESALFWSSTPLGGSSEGGYEKQVFVAELFVWGGAASRQEIRRTHHDPEQRTLNTAFVLLVRGM